MKERPGDTNAVAGSESNTDLLAISAKIVVAGGFGVGKTTFVGSVSEVPPLSNEAWMTEAGAGVDELVPPGTKSTTTVAMDFGRITLREDLLLYLFGTPGQARFWFLWDDLSRGALGAVVLVDTSRIDQSFAAINYFENDSELPFIVAVNQFEGMPVHDLEEVRDALALSPDIPLVTCDARDPKSAVATLQELVSHTLSLAVVSGPGREFASLS
ncbi:ATP/GTP-binding protein [Amycolatopsis sp. EV170708-02-1]|uniref:GTP-binding protein n=1 Tax=Amycolatopsis sp. EV170708-02-1 TaxID=2919322 RepID=UPI001F0C5BDA|nr:ATP/GTP-binding protein [Amycolatopsis sp. EV170708-02-1]UMP07359.1 ATP/GTP-binding protein [Amycolatopsis sp. EV170708-02-1]